MDADVPEVESNAAEKPFFCPTCKKCFPTKANLKSHMVTHSEQRPFACDHAKCNKTFKRKNHLEQHKNIHTREKLFPCLQCNKSFTHKGDLQRHVLIHTGERPFACDHAQCNKRFKRRSHLKQHKETHRGVQPFVCLECKINFTRKIDLQMHELTHTVKLYTCPQCDKSFEVYRFYLHHLQIHIIENREMLLMVHKLTSRMNE